VMTREESAAVQLPAPGRAILALSATGQDPTDIAADLHLSLHDVREHLATAVTALGAASKLEALLAALRLRLILVPSTLQCDLLRALAGGATLAGTLRTLARSLHVTMTDLRAGLRGLLEVELIAVHSEASDRVVVRL